MDARPAAVESGQDLIVGADGLLRRETGLEQAAVAGAPIARSLAPAGYRPDIDGLRAIAVVAVVLCHYQIGPFTGGFVGVDVFFVISGFLITSLIYKETREGRFSIVEFYERRIRRIFPALFFMLALVTAVAFAILLPQDLRTYGASLVATTLFASNVKFFQEVNYFDVAAELKPLLHTWSLAVEEQYYLAFPPLLLLLRKRPASQIIAVVAALAVASLALAA